MSKSNYYSFDEWKKFYLKLKEKSKYGMFDFNNRFFEPFHLLSTDSNKLNIEYITDSMIKLFFPKPECFICSGNVEPRPMSCYKTKECMWFIHNRYSKEFDDRCPIMELSQKNSNLMGFCVSRPTISIHVKHPWLRFMCRTSRVNKIIMHHKKMDKFWDYPDDIILLPESFHISMHTKFKSCLENIKKVETKLVTEIDPDLNIELEILNSKKNSYVNLFNNLSDDSEIMIFLEELNNRIIKFRNFLK